MDSYDRHCHLKVSASEAAQRIADGEDHCVRLLHPKKGDAEWNDIVQGKIVIPISQLDLDPVLITRTGKP